MSEQLDKLRANRAALLKAGKEFQQELVDDGDRKRTPEEQGRFDGWMEEAEGLTKEINALARLEAVQTEADASKRVTEPEKEIRTDARVEVMPVYDKTQLRAFTGPHALRDAYRASKWAEGYIFDRPEARQWCTANAVVGYNEKRVMVEAVGASGGALVPTEMEQAIINIRNKYGMARQECRQIDMGSDTMEIPRRTGGLTAYFPSETTATSASDTAWDTVTLTAQEVSCLTRVSKNLAEDSIISIADMLADEVGQAFAAKEDACLVDGDGTNTYGGMVGFRTRMSLASGNAGAYIQATANDDQWGEYIIGDIVQVPGILPEHSQANAKWYMSRICWGQTFVRLAAAVGGSSLQSYTNEPVNLGYLGYPVKLYAAMPSATTAYNDVIVFIFGDLSRSTTMGTRRGMSLEVDRSRYLEYRQLGVIGTERFHIVNHDCGTATAAGCIVGMLGQT